MTNEIVEIKRAIKARLESVSGLRVITFAPDDWRDFPVAIVRLDNRTASRAGVAGSSFDAEFVVTVMVGGSKARDAYDTLDSYIASDGAMSVEAAIKADPTLGGVARVARLTGVENIRIVSLGGGRYAGADFRLCVEKRTGVGAVLELYDGSSVIDLLGPPYFGSGEVKFGPVEREPASADPRPGLVDSGYVPRTMEIGLAMRESGAGQPGKGLNALSAICARAERRSRSEWGSAVRLRRGADSRTIEYRTLGGGVELIPRSGEDDSALGVKLSLSVEALGRLTEVESSATLWNERDGANRNYMDFTDIPGSHSAPAQIRIDDPSGTWSDEGKMWIGKRSGYRRAINLFFQAEDGSIERGSSVFEDGGGIWSGDVQLLSEASGGEYARMQWMRAGSYTTRSAFTLCGCARIAIAAAGAPRGRFRVLVRARSETDNPELQVGRLGFALGWSLGSSSKTPEEGDAVFPATASEFRTLDLGELKLPPTSAPEGYATPGFDLDIYGVLGGGDAANGVGAHHFRWLVDYVMLLPIDEGEVVVNSVGTSERMLLDTLSEAGPGVFMLDESGAAIGVADFEGAPFTIGPEDTRVYIARDDVSDPSGVKFRVAATLTPLVAGV